ncbi:hypothetical protein M9Y10_034133 [Tritrichomonas musculus]|uniref:Uncharacterized protein n=1 Tax=Tritrichomonas musculus TaxID=1915356 RepID=A0ABR2KE53_9EUKA
MFNINTLFSNEKVQPELQKIVDGLDKVCQSRKQRIHAQEDLVKNTNLLVKSEVPQFEKTVTFSLEPFLEIAKIETDLLQNEIRCREDFNDVIERYKAIQRLQRQQEEAIAAVDKALAKLKDANIFYQTELNNNKLGSRLKQAEDAVSKAKKARSTAINTAKKLTIQLIEEKKKFNKFKLNRIRHGCQTYSSSVADAAQKEAELYQQIANNFAEARKQIETTSLMDSANETISMI